MTRDPASPSPGAPPAGGLVRAAAAGVRWTSVAAGAVALLGLVQVAVLAHLLSPSAFGQAAAVAVTLGIAQMFGDLGVSASIIQKQTTDRRELSTLYWTNVAVGVALGAGVLALRGPIAALFGDEEIAGLLVWAAAGFVLAPLGLQFQVLLQRDLRFEVLARIDVAAKVLGVAVAVASALAGLDALAIVLGVLATSAARSALLVAWGWRGARPLVHWRPRELRGHLSFGAYQLGERTVGYLAANVDYLLIGAYLGTQALGLYTIAYQTIIKPLQLVNPALTRVAFPVLAKRRDDVAAQRRGFVEMTRLLALVLVPPLAGLAATAPLVVPVVFGDRWEAAVPLFQILAGVGILRALVQPIGSVLLARNRPDLGFKFALAGLIATALVLRMAVEGDVETVAWAFLGLSAVLYGIWIPIFRRLLDLSPRTYLGALVRPVAYGALVVGAALLGGAAAPEPGAVGAAVAVAAGAAAFAAALAAAERAYVGRLWGLFTGRAS